MVKLALQNNSVLELAVFLWKLSAPSTVRLRSNEAGGDSVIRQAISCDICGTEMLSVNHWFVAYDRGSELRIARWSSNHRLKVSARHLCGHKCLHKLVDDFMAESIGGQAPSPATKVGKNPLKAEALSRDRVFTTAGPHRMERIPSKELSASNESFESATQLIRPAEPIAARVVSATTALRSEAWKRERQRQAEKSAAGRRSIA